MTINTVYKIVALLLTFLPLVYQQIVNNSTNCSKETFAVKVVFDFWHESIQGCEIDAQNLLKVYKKISLNTNNDKISDILRSHVSSTLMETLFNQLLTTISTKSFTAKPQLEEVINQLYKEPNNGFIVELWQKVLDESSQFMDEEEIVQQILLLTNGQLKLDLLEYLLTKYENQHKYISKLLPLITFGVSSVLKQRQQSQSPIGDPRIGRLLSKLPEQLLTIFQSWNYNVSILNGHYNEYLFPEHSNGSIANKRFLFSFLPAKNKFRLKGKFKLQFNQKGLLTFGAPYDGTYKYLTVEEKSAFICLDCAIDVAQWWLVLWPHNDTPPVDQQFVLFQNVATQQLLCTTSIYNEDFVLISTLDLAQHTNDSQCLWKVVKRDI